MVTFSKSESQAGGARSPFMLLAKFVRYSELKLRKKRETLDVFELVEKVLLLFQAAFRLYII